jgi:peptidoglycan/LPS O-acetylase OafA/YrhL
MKRLWNLLTLYLIVLLASLVVSFAFAQAVEPNWNFTTWGGSLLAFAGGVSAIMAVVRRYVWKELDGELVKVVAIGVGVAAGISLSFTGQFDTILSGAINGLLAGLGSFLGVDALRDVVMGQGMSGKSGA